jgi:TolB-like protein
VVVAGVVLLAAAVVAVWHLAGGADEPRPEGGRPVVAVLPFEALGGGEADVFAEGMHGDLLTRLAGVPGLDVIASTSVEHYREANLPVATIADSLGATWIVEGEVQRTDGRIRVTAQLVEPGSRKSVWADSYRRDLTARDLFELQADIARNIVRSVQARVTIEEAERVERRPTDDLRAYRSYLRGRNRLEERTKDGTLAAARHFRRAVREDSSFALAWARLAETAVLIDEYGYGPLPGGLATPERAARRALSLDSTLAQAHVARGYLHLLRAEGPAAVRAFRRAVDLQPGSSGAHFRLGEALAMVGRIERTVQHVERAVELDPLAPFPRVPLGGFYHLVGRHGEALRQIRRGRAIAPDLAIAHLLEGQRWPRWGGTGRPCRRSGAGGSRAGRRRSSGGF